MPLIHESHEEPDAPQPETTDDESTVEEDDALLLQDGRLTMEAEAIGAFLMDVDWDAAFEHPECQEHIEEQVVLGREVEDPETGAVHLEVFEPANESDDDTAADDLTAQGASVEEKAYGKGKKMKGKKMSYYDTDDKDGEDDKTGDYKDETTEGEATMAPPKSGSLSTAAKQGMAGKGGSVRIGLGGAGTGPTHVGKGDKQHKPGAQAMSEDEAAARADVDFDPTQYDDVQFYETADDGEGIEIPEGLAPFVIQTLPGGVVAEHVDLDDLMEMLPYFIDELPEDTIEQRARKALFNDIMEVDVAATLGLDADDLTDEELAEAQALYEKSPFKKGDFKRRQFKRKVGKGGKAKPGYKKAHDQRVRMVVAMMKKGVLRRTASGQGYKGGDYQYKNPSGVTSKRKLYAKHKIKNISKIKKNVKSRKIGPTRRKIVKAMVYKNLGSKMPGKWKAPELRTPSKFPDDPYGLGSLYYAVTGAKKKKAKKGGSLKKKAAMKKGSKGKKGLKASAPQIPANLTEAADVPATKPTTSLSRTYSGTGAKLAGLVESRVRGARAEHQEALDEDTE